jgi:hypothetical protein
MHANAALSLSLARSRSLSRSCVAVRNPPPDAQRTGPFTYFRNLDQRLRAPFGHLSSIVLVGFGLGLVWWVQVFLQREADQHRRWSSVPWKWWIQPAIVGALLAIFPIVTLLRPLVEGDATEEKEKDNPSTQPKELTPEEREKREFQSAQAQEAEYRGLQAARWKEINGKQSDEVERRRSSRVETGARPVPIQNGVGFSGGGIRAAAYATGAAKALLQTGVWPHIQYMSSVSGGGYITSAIALDHKSFRDEKTTGDFLYKRALNAGYCFRQDGTIGQLISSFVHFSSRIVCGMVINNLVLFGQCSSDEKTQRGPCIDFF